MALTNVNRDIEMNSAQEHQDNPFAANNESVATNPPTAPQAITEKPASRSWLKRKLFPEPRGTVEPENNPTTLVDVDKDASNKILTLSTAMLAMAVLASVARFIVHSTTDRKLGIFEIGFWSCLLGLPLLGTKFCLLLELNRFGAFRKVSPRAFRFLMLLACILSSAVLTGTLTYFIIRNLDEYSYYK